MPLTPPETARRSLHALPSGTVLREYVVESVLGSGGFGVVYRAHHTDVGTPVAIKVYLPVDCAVRSGQAVEPGSGSATTTYQAGLQRFAKEAQQLEKFRRLSGIVSVRGFFHANGTAYLVMDYEDGLPLLEFLRRREAEGSPATEADLLAVAVPLLKALSVVHKAAFFHRDIKPANIFIRREDAVSGRPAEPVLIDFGAAKQVHAAHTRSQTSFCTPGYAPLEQLSTSAEDLGPWTDLYALGAVMWRMVAGGVDLGQAVSQRQDMYANLRFGECGLALEHLGKRFAVEVFHHDIPGAVRLQKSLDLNDVGVIEASQHAGFIEKTLKSPPEYCLVLRRGGRDS